MINCQLIIHYDNNLIILFTKLEHRVQFMFTKISHKNLVKRRHYLLSKLMNYLPTPWGRCSPSLYSTSRSLQRQLVTTSRSTSRQPLRSRLSKPECKHTTIVIFINGVTQIESISHRTYASTHATYCDIATIYQMLWKALPKTNDNRVTHWWWCHLRDVDETKCIFPAYNRRTVMGGHSISVLLASGWADVKKINKGAVPPIKGPGG